MSRGRVRLRLPRERLQVPRPPRRARGRRSGCASSTTSGPLRYAELARALDVPVGGSAPLADVREAVLALRRGKGMVIDPADPDSVSAGSFFTNPILEPTARGARRSAARVARARRPRQDLGGVADRAGRASSEGYGDGRVGISTKHTLALVNRGGATTAELMALAREIAGGRASSASASRCTPSRCSSATTGNRQRFASAPKPPRRIVRSCPTTSNTPWSPP